jgi:hypothetical protein
VANNPSHSPQPQSTEGVRTTLITLPEGRVIRVRIVTVRDGLRVNQLQKKPNRTEGEDRKRDAAEKVE